MNLKQLRENALGRCLLKPDQPVLVGVSGGGDSLCLMAALAQLGFPVIAAYFDHRLRTESAADAVVVAQAAERLGLPFISGGANVTEFARSERLSIEAAARSLRYRFLFAQARQHGAQAVAVGHTADDQVETVLMHLLRGSGLAGLTGMDYRRVLPEWDNEIPLARPLLDFWRADTVAFCQEQGLQPVTDATNADVAFARNRIRHELIPLLETYNPQVRRAMWRMARSLASDFAVVQAAVETAWEACLFADGPGFAMLKLDPLARQPEAVQRGLIRQAAGMAAPLPDGIDFDAVERAMELIRQPAAGVQIDLTSDLRAWVEDDLLVLARKDAELPAEYWPQLAEGCEPIEIPVPGTVLLPSGWRLDIKLAEAPEKLPGSIWHAYLDASLINGPLMLRCARVGERFQPVGMDGRTVKLSDYWTNVKLPRRARARWALVVCGDTIAWVAGQRVAHPYRVTETTRQVIAMVLYRQA